MPEFTAVSVTDAGSITLLTQYFSDRASTFPSAGGYRTTFPAPEQFVPPRGQFLLVSETQGSRTFVGCGGIRRIDDGADGAVRFEAKHLWLQPEVRGRGWGTLLLAELETRARAFGATELVLDTNSSLEAAGALYQRSGYQDVPPYNDNPNATNWYRKVLAPTP
ncbi:MULTISPECIES: GNAT family N-acetyltransferase [Cryobacterium]|uniref:PadR family transcriptional regulator n=1 Tax=Cryobacterium zongtaii TaxID=1259217 RepID=A0A2S3ZKD5_9MICO|nr:MULTISPECIES: GNAT family N-acetyltransferase [Cryobacterium]POH63093.1 PadR family transcriptional regulator [Cryobacterium zongtaii]POH68811.1 PadR family transcriptional regulator [Cryobacterium zongtaii]TFC43786.1 GNAT family N-acetyltransferase [Cryobacterium sp. TMN-39-2]TFC62548.1 GNAT family N-acetyltransferase [Cryobacterium sp. TMB1-7]TFC84997.1 GNAT family N-acetyltransferase [Cryobacterium sp. TMT4-31]